MNSSPQHSNTYPVAQQTINNTTSWIGHTPGNATEIVRGQTFIAERDGDLPVIEVIPNHITNSGRLVLTFYSFDEIDQQWGPALGSVTVSIDGPDTGKWIPFQLPALHLHKGRTYGFRLECHDCLVGMGEAAGSSKNPPLSSGKEWRFMGNNQQGDAFSYFSLAFRVGLRA